ncbi:unnamed protein product [Auanema sp. JU1783]|nr:unnamed protein product [Auanema sp. JU1783]
MFEERILEKQTKSKLFMAQQPPPYYNHQPTSSQVYYQPGTNYPQAPNGAYNPYQPQPQIIYVERPQQRDSSNDWWLTSLLALCCGCCLGEMLCDSPCLCCVLPCPIRMPRFR